MIEIGIFEKTFVGRTLEDRLDAVAAHGIGHIQIHLEATGIEPMPLEVPEAIRRRIRDETTRRGIAVAGLSATYNMAHPDHEVRRDGLSRLEVLAASAAELGTTVLTLCTGTRDPDDKWRYHRDNGTPEAWADLASSIGSAILIAERHAVTLAIEPEPANIVRDAYVARRLLDEMGSDRLKIILDAANIVAGALHRPPDDTLTDAFALLGDHILMAHAKDVDRDGRFCPAGDGIVPWSTFVRLLGDSGFDGPLILHSLTEENVPRCIATLTAASADR